MWQQANQLVSVVDRAIKYVAQQHIDKVRIAMFVTWTWAVAGLYVAKAFEIFFRLMMCLPDTWFSAGQPVPGIHIMHAHDGHQTITNKFKIFLKYFWEKDADSANGGFNFATLQRMLNCSVLYCSYLLTNADGSIDPETFWTNMNKFLVSLDAGNCMRYTNSDLSAGQHVPFGNVRFNVNTKSTHDINEQTKHDILDFLNSTQ